MSSAALPYYCTMLWYTPGFKACPPPQHSTTSTHVGDRPIDGPDGSSAVGQYHTWYSTVLRGQGD